MIMKKLCCLILVLVMLLSMVACGSKKAEEKVEAPAEQPAASEEAAKNEPAEEKKEEETIMDTVVTAEDPSFMPAVTEITADTKFQKEIVVANYGDLPVLDTMGSNDVCFGAAFMMVFERLVKMNDATGEVEPQLAESWEISDDGMTYTFHIVQNATFHTGEPVKASDVVFTFNRAKEQPSAAAKIVGYESATALDDYTVEVKMATPNADLMYNLTYCSMSILSEKAVTEDPAGGLKIGCGPYELTEWVSGDHCTVVRYEDYYGEKPYTEKFTFKVMTEASARLIALQSGDVDICLNPDKVELDFIREDPNVTLLETNGVKMYYIVMNMTKPPFDDVRVRQAVAYCVDKQSMIDVAAEGLGVVAHTFFPPTMTPYTSNDYDFYYPSNIEKAKELLAEAGYPDGFEITFLARDEARVLQAQLLQESLKQIGITMNIEQCDTAAMRSAIREKTYDICGYNWSNDLAPDMSCSDLFATGRGDNNSHFSEPWFDETAQKALATTDVNERAELYHEMQKFVMERAPLIPLYYENTYIAVDSKLENFTLDSININDFTTCYIVEE